VCDCNVSRPRGSSHAARARSVFWACAVERFAYPGLRESLLREVRCQRRQCSARKTDGAPQVLNRPLGELDTPQLCRLAWAAATLMEVRCG